MHKLVPLIVAAIMTSTTIPSSAGPAEDGAAAIDRWAAAYNSADLDALMKAYAPDARMSSTIVPVIGSAVAALAGLTF